jgi:hypothetical protein
VASWCLLLPGTVDGRVKAAFGGRGILALEEQHLRLHWPSREAPLPHPVGAPSAEHVLGAGELARLGAYRAAVRAGFYNDWPITREAEHMTESTRLRPRDIPASADLGGAA